MPSFKMDTAAGRRLQLQECMFDIERALDDEDDDLTRIHMTSARDALRTVLVLMEVREPAPHHHEYVGGRCVHCGFVSEAKSSYVSPRSPFGI